MSEPEKEEIASQATEKVKNTTDTSVSMCIKDAAGEEVYFRVKPETLMSKVFDAYAKRKGVSVGALRFLFEGKRVDGNQTPKLMEIEDGDQIDVLLEQVGGVINL